MDTPPNTERFLQLLHTLAHQPSVVGNEHSFFRALQRELELRGATVVWYNGLLVATGSDPTRAMFSAHVDRHGLVCAGPNEFQYAAFVSGSRSDLLGNSVSEQLINKVVDRFPNQRVYAYEPWSGAYRGQGRIRRAYKCDYRANLIFELEGLEHLVAGTPVAFFDEPQVTDGAVSGQLDNTLTVAALVYLFELGFEGTAFFTAEEEAGKSWRYLMEWFRRFKPETRDLIVVDTSPYIDMAAARAQRLTLRHKDANASFDPDTTERARAICERLGHAVMFKDTHIDAINAELAAAGEPPRSLGSTELGRVIAASDGNITGTTLQIPTTNYHTLDETAALDSVTAFLEVCLELAK